MKRNRIIKFIFYTCLLWFIAHITWTITDGLKDDHDKADIAIILGNKVNTDGSLSERLKQRLECGLALYKETRVKKLLVSGGLGVEGFYEGSKMKAFLSEKGVPDSCIIVDNKGDNTRATVENTLKLKDSLRFKSVIVVSQYFHVTRTKMLFRKRNLDKVSSVSPSYFEFRDIYALAREFFAYYFG